MTHQKCNEEISLNIDLMNQFHQGAQIKAFTIVEKSVADIEAEIKRILNEPEVPADSVIGKDYDVYLVLNKNEFNSEEKVDYIQIQDVVLDELFFF